ncbi:lipoate protein ligase, putative [Leishmania tarentolae]|uniref:lipoyl(octanoyl) transferase n=1 Tax=Leishmania tarentolae TaxID=5689 RepID=A0A640L0S0_LEITA|nr:lipoate protein ligase, putative [Leishmania tarentolae]
MKAFFIGKREYRRVLSLQETIFNAKIARQVSVRRGESKLPLLPNIVILVEHSTPVYTIGRRDTAHGLPPHCSVEVVKTRRGGGITYHGPGQLTMYPIVNIQLLWKHCTAEKVRSPIEWFSWVLEEAMIQTAAMYHIPSHRFKTGVWADEYKDIPAQKLGAIGLQLGSWVSMHGAGFNIANDLHFFDDIIMCEMPGRRATSLSNEMQHRGITESPPLVQTTAPILLHKFNENLHQSPGCSAPQLVDLSMDSDWYERVADAAGISML